MGTQKPSIKDQLTINGETMTVKEWAKVNGLNIRTVYSRIANGKSGADLVAPKCSPSEAGARRWQGKRPAAQETPHNAGQAPVIDGATAIKIVLDLDLDDAKKLDVIRAMVEAAS